MPSWSGQIFPFNKPETQVKGLPIVSAGSRQSSYLPATASARLSSCPPRSWPPRWRPGRRRRGPCRRRRAGPGRRRRRPRLGPARPGKDSGRPAPFSRTTKDVVARSSEEARSAHWLSSDAMQFGSSVSVTHDGEQRGS